MNQTATDPPAKLAGWFGGGFGILWLLFWSAITCAFDGLWLWMMVTQSMAWTYPAAEGTIVESSLERGTDSDGDATYDAKVVYEFSVQGKPHRGDTIRNFSMRMNGGRQQAEQSIDRYPAGKRVTVYYDPARPSQSVLERGFHGGDFFLPLFMVPFNMIMLGGWYGVVGSWRKGRQPSGMRVRDDGLKVVARFYDVTPLMAAAVAVMASSFVLIFVCGFGMMALPVDWLVPLAWVVVLGSAAIAWYAYRMPVTTLEYDHFSGRVLVTAKGSEPHEFTASAVVAVGRMESSPELEQEEDDDEDCDDDDADDEEDEVIEEPVDETPGAFDCPTITYRDAAGQEQTVALCHWPSGDAATWLATWLRETLRLTASPPS